MAASGQPGVPEATGEHTSCVIRFWICVDQSRDGGRHYRKEADVVPPRPTVVDCDSFCSRRSLMRRSMALAMLITNCDRTDTLLSVVWHIIGVYGRGKNLPPNHNYSNDLRDAALHKSHTAFWKCWRSKNRRTNIDPVVKKSMAP